MTIDFIKLLTAALILFAIGWLAVALYYLIHIGNKYLDKESRINLTGEKIKNLGLFLFAVSVFALLLYKYFILRLLLSTAIFSALLAFLLNPILEYLEKKKIRRVFAIALIYIMMFVILAAVAALIVPTLTEQTGKLLSRLPVYFEDAVKFLGKLETEWDLKKYGISMNNISYQDIAKNFAIIDPSKWMNAAWKSVSNLPTAFLSFFLVTVFTFFMLIHKTDAFEKLVEFLPSRFKGGIEEYKKIMSGINSTIGQYLKGKLIMAAFVGVTTAIMLLLLGVDFAFVIGLLTFIGDIVPYVGPLFGFLPAVFFALIESPIKAVVVGLIFLFLQWVENNIVAPKVLSPRTGMHPLLVLLCIVVGGGSFGLIGMIFSVPIVAVVLSIFGYYVEKKRSCNNEKNGS